MRWLTRLIPSRAAIATVIAALMATLLAWARRDARRDLEQRLEKEDITHAKEISDRVRTDRGNPERLREYEDAGWRD